MLGKLLGPVAAAPGGWFCSAIIIDSTPGSTGTGPAGLIGGLGSGFTGIRPGELLSLRSTMLTKPDWLPPQTAWEPLYPAKPAPPRELLELVAGIGSSEPKPCGRGPPYWYTGDGEGVRAMSIRWWAGRPRLSSRKKFGGPKVESNKGCGKPGKSARAGAVF